MAIRCLQRLRQGPIQISIVFQYSLRTISFECFFSNILFSIERNLSLFDTSTGHHLKWHTFKCLKKLKWKHLQSEVKFNKSADWSKINIIYKHSVLSTHCSSSGQSKVGSLAHWWFTGDRLSVWSEGSHWQGAIVHGAKTLKVFGLFSQLIKMNWFSWIGSHQLLFMNWFLFQDHRSILGQSRRMF